MQVDQLLLETENNTLNANKIKNLVLDRLLTDKVITDEQAKDYSEKWQIIIIKGSWFTSWIKGDENNYSYKLVRFED